jgi:hypothetical protein
LATAAGYIGIQLSVAAKYLNTVAINAPVYIYGSGRSLDTVEDLR